MRRVARVAWHSARPPMAPRANLGPKPLGISCEHDLMGRANLNLDLRYNLDTTRTAVEPLRAVPGVLVW